MGRLLALAALILSSLTFFGAGHDDAWIMLFSGETLGAGTGVLNHNGVPQEMSSSVLGAALAGAASYLAPSGDAFLWWKVVAWLPAIGAGLVFLELLNRSFGLLTALVWLFVLCCFPQWHYWAWGGLESGLFWLAVLLFIDWLAKFSARPALDSGVILAVLAVALPLVRADAIWAPVVCLGAALVVPAAALRHRLRPALVACVLVAAFHALRFSMTGAWFPNPAYAKAPLSMESLYQGFEYLRQFHSDSPLHLFLALACPLALFGVGRWFHAVWCGRRTHPGVYEWSALLLLLIDLSTLAAGGDWMSYHRFAARTLPLKLIVMAHWADWIAQSPGVARLSAGAKRLILVAALLAALTGLTATGIVEREGLYRMGSTIAPAEFEFSRGFADYLMRANIPNQRDQIALLPWIDDELPRLVDQAGREGRLPLKIASYQAGLFPYAIRKKFSAQQVLFIDLAGLSDFRIGSLRGARTPLGLFDGTHRWAEALTFGASELGKFLRACRPDVVYVLAVSDAELKLMDRAGYDVMLRKNAVVDGLAYPATIFVSRSAGDGRCPPLDVGA